MLDVFQTDRFKQSLNTLSQTTGKLAGIMKNDARLRARDYGRISENNRRLRRVIPIIPGVLGTAGYIFGLPDPSEGFGLPGFPGFGLPPIPPRPPGPPGPGAPPGPVGPPVGPPPPPPIIKEDEVEEPTVVDVPADERSPDANRRRQEEAKREAERKREEQRKKEEEERRRREEEKPEVEPAPQTVPLPEKPKEPEPDKEAEPGRDPIPLPAPPPPPIPLTPPIPRRRRKKEKEEEKELVPTRMTAYQFELALRSRRQQEKGADPAWLAPYYQYLGDYFRKTQRSGAVQLPDGGLLTMNVVGGLVNRRRPEFKYYNGIEWAKTTRNTQKFSDIMNLVQTVFAVMGPFTGAQRPTTQPGRTTTTPDPTYRPPKPEPAVPLPSPGNVIVPTSPGGGPLGRPQPVPKAQPTQRLLPAQGLTIDVTPTQSSTTRTRGIIEQIFNPSGRPTRVKQFSDAYKEYSNEQLYMMIRKATDSRTRIEYQRILDKRIQENVLNDAGAVQGPVPGPQASAIIQPIIVFRDPPTA